MTDIVERLRAKSAERRAVGWETSDVMTPKELDEVADYIDLLKAKANSLTDEIRTLWASLAQRNAEVDQMRVALEEKDSEMASLREALNMTLDALKAGRGPMSRAMFGENKND